MLFLLTCGLALTGMAQEMVIDDPNASVRTLSGSFTRLRASGGIDVYLSQGSTEALAISAGKEKYKDNIHTDIVDGELQIYYGNKDEVKGFEWVMGNKKIKVYLSFKTLTAIKGSGACNFWVNDTLTSPVLSLNLSGACDFKGALKVTDLNIDMSGASDSKLSGTAVSANLEASGASDIRSYDLAIENCTARASGASSISITVNGSFRASASGASDIRYKGNCTIADSRSSGASSISKRD